jgi:hypothetical protein
MSDLIGAINAMTPGITTRFVQMYASVWKQTAADFRDLMDLAVPSDGAWNIYSHFKSAPHAKRWPRGTPRGSKGFDAYQYTVVNHDWAVGVEAHENDVADDRTGSAVGRAQDAGKNAGRIPVKVFFQIDGAQTNPLLLPSNPNCPDGAALFSATDGNGDDRFGVVGGNVLSGSGVASVSAIQADYARTIVRAKQYRDTEGEPYYSDDIEREGVTIVASVDNWFVLHKAFEQDRTVVVVNAAGAEGATSGVVAATSPSNPLRDLGLGTVRILTSPYKTGNSWSVYFHAAPIKPIFQQTRSGLEYLHTNRYNNAFCARDKTVGWFWDWREGYGTNIPIGCAKVSN